MRVESIGLPAETKDQEKRVALTPGAVAAIAHDGHRVIVQAGSGEGAGYADSDYRAAGAEIVPDAGAAWSADVVVKVKEPQPSEYGFFRRDLTLFAYLHLAAASELTKALQESGARAYAFETLEERGGLPLLAPMSEVAGRVAAIAGAYHLSNREGGSGTLMGGASGVLPARVAVIGMGVAGTMAAHGARGLDAHVTGVDIDLQRLYDLRTHGVIHASLASDPVAIGALVCDSDLVIGAALVPGAKAPIVVTEAAVAAMRPGSVVVDLAIDQGGCVETSRPTTLSDPTFDAHGVVHYCVTNVPGQFPRTASAALSAAVMPRLLRLLANPDDPSLKTAANVIAGDIVHPAVARAMEGCETT